MIKLERLAVTYPGGVKALKPTTLNFRAGELVVLLGSSGAGKSTLLRCLNGLVRPSQGRVLADDIGDIAERRTLHRHRQRTGMIFQQHQLIGRSTVLSNVLTGRLGYHPSWRSLLPLPRQDKRITLDCLARVDLLDYALTRVDQLSGGQQQRVGIARALAQQPSLILADEPVASLDPASATAVLSKLRTICEADGIAAILSLHQVELAKRFADRIIGIASGSVKVDTHALNLSPDVIEAIYGPSHQAPRKKQSSVWTAPRHLSNESVAMEIR